jgi:hypothetical protein
MEVGMLIEFILRDLRAQGVVVPEAVGSATMVHTHEHYGGERVYVPKLPKLQSSARIAKAAREGSHQTAEIVKATGLSRASVKRLRIGGR